jgi:hypothetical protein
VSSRAGFDTVEEENCPASNQTSVSSTSRAHSIFSVPTMGSNTRSNDDDDNDDCGGGGSSSSSGCYSCSSSSSRMKRFAYVQGTCETVLERMP